MQIDLTTIRRGKKSLKAFVATLGYSRASYVKFFDNERAQSWQQGLREAFDYFGGVPHEVLCDNAQSLIIERISLRLQIDKRQGRRLNLNIDYFLVSQAHF